MILIEAAHLFDSLKMLQAVHNMSLDTHGCKLQLELFADYNNSLALIPVSVGCPDLNPCYLNNKLPLVVTRSSLKTFQGGKYICSLILISPNFTRRPANQGKIVNYELT